MLPFLCSFLYSFKSKYFWKCISLQQVIISLLNSTRDKILKHLVCAENIECYFLTFLVFITSEFCKLTDCLIIIFSEKERQQCGVSESCGCLWAYLADLRSLEGNSHVHYNPFYDPPKHCTPLLPPAAALAPTLWPQFHLRWACPTEAQAGEVEAQCRNMAIKLSDLQKVGKFYLCVLGAKCCISLDCDIRLTYHGVCLTLHWFTANDV